MYLMEGNGALWTRQNTIESQTWKHTVARNQARILQTIMSYWKEGDRGEKGGAETHQASVVIKQMEFVSDEGEYLL